MSPYKNVVLVGASGSVGQTIVNGLLASATEFNITLLVRADSSSRIAQEGHAAIRVVRGDLSDDAFLKRALTDQEALVVALNSTPDTFKLQDRLVDAAAAVGVKRIIPSDFGSDVTNPKILEAVPLYQGKVDAARYLEEVVAKNPATTWTAVINGPFYDWGMERDLFGFNPKTRTATLYDNGTGKFDSTNITSLGHVVGSILTAPENFTNRYVYVSEFAISQNEIFEALLRATKTHAKDWTIAHRTTEELKKEGLEKIEKWDFSGALDLIFAAVFKAGLGSDYSTTQRIDNAAVGLKQGDILDTTTVILEGK
ncbi:hypothetical protein UA08_02407 [Talaromyces atroroseus]|uniref:NmrA-like domain-containing protein n=1 Tax=Talaromyces atroroseus TaxID=1441469 RepID=A0A225ARB5_TALAT|nr:hypothetical protein UA08_02407 [Talaromyces atroroseus]OKL62043.1 hypothetical protein UA08_02407 [Talaromyces atroroseus]